VIETITRAQIEAARVAVESREGGYGLGNVLYILRALNVGAQVEGPTDEQHEAQAQAFISALDDALISAIRDPDNHSTRWFDVRHRYVNELRNLLSNEAWKATHEERKRFRDRIAKEFR